MDISEYGVGNQRENSATSNVFMSGAASNFDHDTPIMVEDTQADRMDAYVRPVGGVSGNGPYNFEIPPSADSYLLMNNITLYVKAKITKSDGSDCAATDNVAPVCGLGAVMWEHAEVSLNDYAITGASASNTHYKAYLETILSHDSLHKDTSLRCQLFYMDDAATTDNPSSTNKGWLARQKLTKLSAEFDMCGPLTIDFLRANKHLAPGNKLNIKLTRAQDRFLLYGPAGDYRLEIVDLQLRFYRVRLTEKKIPPRIENYFFSRTELKRFPVPTGQPAYHLTLFRGHPLPKSIIIAQVATDSAEGELSKNPFNFHHFNLSRLSLRVNGRAIPSDDYTPDFSKKLVHREYFSLFANTGVGGSDRGNMISLAGFLKGSTIFPYDLTPDMCNSAHFHEGVPGEITLDLHWTEALTQPITVLALCVYDCMLVKKAGENEHELHTL